MLKVYFFFIILIRTFHFKDIECPIIGIKIGNTNLSVSIWKENRIQIISDKLGKAITSSILTQNDTSTHTKNMNTLLYFQKLKNILYDMIDIKEPKTSQNILRILPYQVLNQEKRRYLQKLFKINSKIYPESYHISLLLKKIKIMAQNYLKKEISKAIITIPYYFNDTQRKILNEAGKMVGLNIIRIIEDSYATCFAYKLDKIENEINTVLVIDVGGETLDVSTLLIDEGIIETLSNHHKNYLGGKMFNKRVLDFLIKFIKRKYSINIFKNLKKLEKLTIEIEKAKLKLSVSPNAIIRVPKFINNQDFRFNLTRKMFEKLNSDLFQSILLIVNQALKKASLKKEKIDKIILSGGSAHIPKIQSILKEFFNKKDLLIDIDPQEVAVIGAAARAHHICYFEIYSNCLPTIEMVLLSLGVESNDGSMITFIPHGYRVPVKISKIFTTYDDNQKSISINIYQGQRPFVKDNILLGNLYFDNIESAPRGFYNVEIIFVIDPSENLIVTAEIKEILKKKTIIIEEYWKKLSSEKTDSLLIESCDYFEEDKLINQKLKIKKEFDFYIYFAKKKLGSDISKEKKSIIKKILKEIKENNKISEIEILTQYVETLKNILEINTSKREIYLTLPEIKNSIHISKEIRLNKL